MSARRLRWDELPDAHRAVYRDQWAAEREVADWFSLPSLTWEQERAALMAGRSLGWMPEGWVGMEGRRGSVAPPSDDTGFNPCDCKAVRDRVREERQGQCDDCASCNPEGNTSGTVVVEACWQTLDSLGNPGDCRCTYHCNPALCNDDSNSCGSQEMAAGSPACFPDIDLPAPSSGGASGWSGSTAGLCFVPGECAYPDLTLDPGIQALPSYVDIQVESFTGRSSAPGTPLFSICGAFAHDLTALLGQAFGLMLANADIVKYALCTLLPPDSDADLDNPGVQPMQSVLACMCSILEGRYTSSITLSAQPTGACRFDEEVSAEYAALFGEDADVFAWTSGSKVRFYMGECGPTTDLRHQDDRLSTSLRVASRTFRRTVHVDEGMIVLIATLAHELLHVCGFRHLGVGGATDITNEYTATVQEMLWVRYSVVGDL